jgi:DNA recombination protein RmuC
MGLQEILSIVILIVTIVGLGVALYAVFRKKETTSQTEDINRLNAEISARIGELKEGVSKSIFGSIMNFNDQVNQKLMDNNQKSAENITAFRIAVNSELGSFQEKISIRLNDSFRGLNEEIEKRMGLINGKVEERLSKGFEDTNKTFQQISERVKIIDEAQKRIQELSTDIIGLQNILTNNQARGLFGEHQLNQLLFSVFGENNKLYKVQYTFREATGKSESVRADAIVYLPKPNNILAIDSKFPFTAFSQLFDNKGLSKEADDKLISEFAAEAKKHITDIASKYIISGVTAEYALMFVPSDGILALIHSRCQNVLEYAWQKKITIVSPTTIIPLLSSFFTITMDNERKKNAGKIAQELMLLKKEFDKFNTDWTKLNDNIEKIYKQSNDVNTHVDKITTKFGQINNLEHPEGEIVPTAAPTDNAETPTE